MKFKKINKKESLNGRISCWLWCFWHIRWQLNHKNKYMWQNKSEVTDEAIGAVRDYMVNKLLGGFSSPKQISSGYEWDLKDGKTVELRITIKK